MSAKRPATNGGDAGIGNNSQQTVRNFELDRAIRHTRQPSGRLRRVTAAVLVDHLPATDADGNRVDQPLSDEQMQRLKLLVQEAIGFDAARGDSVSVVNAAFSRPAPMEPEVVPLWQQPTVLSIGRQLLGAFVVLVIGFAILRPTLRNLVQIRPSANELQVALASAGALSGPPPAVEGQLDNGKASESARDVAALSFDQKLEAAKSAVAQDPKRVARVVQNWVEADG